MAALGPANAAVPLVRPDVAGWARNVTSVAGHLALFVGTAQRPACFFVTRIAKTVHKTSYGV